MTKSPDPSKQPKKATLFLRLIYKAQRGRSQQFATLEQLPSHVAQSTIPRPLRRVIDYIYIYICRSHGSQSTYRTTATKMKSLSLLFALLLAFSPSITTARKRPDNSVLLSQVKTLTLRSGQKTSSRRVASLPQLACTGGNAYGLHEVDVMRCKNAGAEYDAEDVQWTCQASLPPEFKLGSTDVICEGYDSAEDPYVLKGSCGVEYRLVLTEMGEERFGRSAFERAYRNPSGRTVGSAIATGLFWMAFVGEYSPCPLSLFIIIILLET